MEISLKFPFRVKLNTRLPRSLDSTSVSQHHRMVWAGRDLWWSPSPSDLALVTISPSLTQYLGISQFLIRYIHILQGFPHHSANQDTESQMAPLKSQKGDYNGAQTFTTVTWLIRYMLGVLKASLYCHTECWQGGDLLTLQKRFSMFLSMYKTILKL